MNDENGIALLLFGSVFLHPASLRAQAGQPKDNCGLSLCLLVTVCIHAGPTGRPPSDLEITDLDAPAVLAFLEHLESVRANTPRSRNARLTAIRSFFRFASVRDVDHLAIINRVLAIPTKRTDRPLITFLTRSEIDVILASTDLETWLGSRDHALLLTMYNTGARASELANLKCGQVSFGSPTMIQLHGKGRKDRSVPLWPQTSRVLQQWFRVLQAVRECLSVSVHSLVRNVG